MPDLTDARCHQCGELKIKLNPRKGSNPLPAHRCTTKNYKVTMVISETWELVIPARSKFFAEQKIKALSDRQVTARGGTIERTDLFVQVEEAT